MDGADRAADTRVPALSCAARAPPDIYRRSRKLAQDLCGIKSVLVAPEAPPEAGGLPLLMSLPEADAIASTGCGRASLEPLEIPPPERAPGGNELFATQDRPWERIPATSAMSTTRWHDHYGTGTISCFEY